MTVTHTLTVDLVQPGIKPRLYAMQFDANTRLVAITLLSKTQPWEAPADAAFGLSYRKSDGTRGFYTDGITRDANTVSVTLAPQVLTCHGTVEAALVCTDQEGHRIAAFPFEIHVAADPAAGSVASEDYFPQGHAVLYTPQALTAAQQRQARANLGLEAPADAYLYNGIQLPPLPAYDRAKYPYAVICTYREGNAFGAIIPASAVLYLFTAHPEPSGDTIELWLPQIGDLEYKIQAETTQGLQAFTDWGSPTTITERKGPSIANMKWANFDLYYQTDIDGKKGQLYLAATDPVPVYPENGNGSAEAVDAVLYTPQTLTPEQQEQARKNIGAEVSVPVMLNLKDYGIDYASLLLAGGGAAVYEDVGSFWEDVKAVKPGQSLLLTSDFAEVTIVPPPATLYFTATGTEVGNILSTMTFLFNHKFLTATSYMTPYGTSGALLSVAVTGMVDAPLPS